jgi:hypothetical protein
VYVGRGERGREGKEAGAERVGGEDEREGNGEAVPGSGGEPRATEQDGEDGTREDEDALLFALLFGVGSGRGGAFLMIIAKRGGGVFNGGFTFFLERELP